MRKSAVGFVAVILGVLILQGFILSTARETNSQTPAPANVSDTQIVNAEDQPETG
jgi:cytoskeletal protein RodZ